MAGVVTTRVLSIPALGEVTIGEDSSRTLLVFWSASATYFVMPVSVAAEFTVTQTLGAASPPLILSALQHGDLPGIGWRLTVGAIPAQVLIIEEYGMRSGQACRIAGAEVAAERVRPPSTLRVPRTRRHTVTAERGAAWLADMRRLTAGVPANETRDEMMRRMADERERR